MTLGSFIATVGGVGYLRPASGTWGSLAALPLLYGAHAILGPFGILALTAILLAVGTWATQDHCARTGTHDPSEVVIDEVVGQWIALWPVVIGAAHVGADLFDLWPGWIAAFLLFRLFDIVKMGPVRWADEKNTAFGVMLDDVFAGVFAAIGVVILAAISHLGIGV